MNVTNACNAFELMFFFHMNMAIYVSGIEYCISLEAVRWIFHVTCEYTSKIEWCVMIDSSHENKAKTMY